MRASSHEQLAFYCDSPPMPPTPIISCVIPVYNDKPHLARAVRSALDQRDGVQVVLVDDCSTDGSTELALGMARADRRIVALSLPQNRGQGYARNIGAAAAGAPYLTFLDSDDEHVHGWYERALHALQENPDLAAVKGEVELMEVPMDLTIARMDPRRHAIVNSALWNVVMRKIAYQVLGGCPTSRTSRGRGGAEDVLLVGALRQHFGMAMVDHPATRHYVKPNGNTAYFLRRARVVDGRIEFVEETDVERDGSLDQANMEYQVQASENINGLRKLLKPGFRGFRDLLARASAKALRRFSGAR